MKTQIKLTFLTAISFSLSVAAAAEEIFQEASEIKGFETEQYVGEFFLLSGAYDVEQKNQYIDEDAKGHEVKGNIGDSSVFPELTKDFVMTLYWQNIAQERNEELKKRAIKEFFDSSASRCENDKNYGEWRMNMAAALLVGAESTEFEKNLALKKATLMSDYDLAQKLLTYKVNANHRGDESQTHFGTRQLPIHCAASVQMAQLLLDNGAELDSESWFWLMSYPSDPEIITLFKKQGLSVSQYDYIFKTPLRCLVTGANNYTDEADQPNFLKKAALLLDGLTAAEKKDLISREDGDKRSVLDEIDYCLNEYSMYERLVKKKSDQSQKGANYAQEIELIKSLKEFLNKEITQ